jgi:RNA polymerase sigma-70 factor (ECF subfamily)
VVNDATGEAKMQIGHIQSNTSQSNTSIKIGTAAPAELSDQALVQSMADDDKRALKLLYLRHHNRIRCFVTRLTGNESTADEVVNEVFLEAWRHAGEFEGRSQVATWLMSIARFKALSACRRRSEAQLDDRAAAVIEDLSDSPSTAVEKRQRSDVLQKCLAKLTPIHREVINLIYYQGKKIEEVAQCTGAPVSTIKTRMHYARGRMADLLAEAGIDRAWVAI